MTSHLTKPIRAIHFMVLAFLMMIGTQVSAEEIKLSCKTDTEQSTWLNGSEVVETDETVVTPAINLTISDGLIEDKGLMLHSIYDCVGPTAISVDEARIENSCSGLKDFDGNKVAGQKSIKLDRYTGNVRASLVLINSNTFMYVYRGECLKTKKKF